MLSSFKRSFVNIILPFFGQFIISKYLFCSGQESAGICTSEGNSKHFNVKKGMGMINMVFNDESMRKLKGNKNMKH